jgi:hypothetical protein
MLYERSFVHSIKVGVSKRKTYEQYCYVENGENPRSLKTWETVVGIDLCIVGRKDDKWLVTHTIYDSWTKKEDISQATKREKNRSKDWKMDSLA